MHVERRRIAAQHVIVDGGDLDPVLDQLGHHRIDFGLEQDEVAHDHRLVANLLERRVGAEGKPCFHRDTLHRDGEVSARHADPEDVAGLHLS